MNAFICRHDTNMPFAINLTTMPNLTISVDTIVQKVQQKILLIIQDN